MFWRSSVSGSTGWHALKLIAAFTAVTALDACGAAILDAEMKEAQAARETVMRQKTGIRLVQPPSPVEMGALLGEPVTSEAGDLVIHVYDIDYDQIGDLNALVKSRGADNGWLREAEPTFSGWDAVGLVILAPALAVTLPVDAAALTAEPERLERAVPATRRLLFTYDEAANYRWSLCCLPGANEREAEGEASKQERLRQIASVFPSSEPAADPVIREDLIALKCYLAKAGDANTRWSLSILFENLGAEPVEAYYWARAYRARAGMSEAEASNLWRVRGFSDDLIAKGDAYYAARPLGGIDCRNLARRIATAGAETRDVLAE